MYCDERLVSLGEQGNASDGGERREAGFKRTVRRNYSYGLRIVNHPVLFQSNACCIVTRPSRRTGLYG